MILADGKSLVTQVMPTALLEQSRSVLRTRFGAIVPKRIFTLGFDRSFEEGAAPVHRLLAKLDSARRHRAVVCAAPESIKSLVLKFVEQLHSIESVPLHTLAPRTDNARANRDIARAREQMLLRSEMSDALVRILDLWRDGVLIMDECDLLMHPLKSELNFPIGHKQPIDLAGHRW